MSDDQQELAALERHVGDQATSPLFAKLASMYLESGRAQDALRLCDAGLANYPFYSTGHLVKGKALLNLGMNNEARRELEFVKNWLPTNLTVSDLLASVPMSDDLVLEAPPEPSAAEPVSEEPAMEGPAESVPEPAAEDTANVFGLPDEVPSDDQTSSPAADTAAAPAVEHSFDDYALRKRGELGQTGQTTLEEFLASSSEQEVVPAEPVVEPSAGAEDAFAAADFGDSGQTETFQTTDPNTAFVTEDASGMDAFGGADQSASAELQAEEPETSSFDMSGMDAFGGGESTPSDGADPFGGTTESLSSEPAEEPPTTVEPSGMDAFGGTAESTEVQAPEENSGMDAFQSMSDAVSEDEGTAATLTAESAEETTPTEESSGMDMFGGTDESAPAQDESPAPDFGGGEQPDSPQAEMTESTLASEENSGMDAFQGTAETVSEDEGKAEHDTADAGTQTEDPFASGASGEDIFSGFVGPDETSSETPDETAPEHAAGDEEASFPDFSGLPALDEPDQQEDDSASGPEPDTGGFSGPPMEDPVAPARQPDKIEEFAEKLQDAKKITPVIDLSSQVTADTASSADEAAADAGFVTPTLAEIYAKQGWYDDAINAYKTLAKSRPAEKEKFAQRVKELEEEKSKAE